MIAIITGGGGIKGALWNTAGPGQPTQEFTTPVVTQDAYQMMKEREAISKAPRGRGAKGQRIPLQDIQ